MMSTTVRTLRLFVITLLLIHIHGCHSDTENSDENWTTASRDNVVVCTSESRDKESVMEELALSTKEEELRREDKLIEDIANQDAYVNDIVNDGVNDVAKDGVDDFVNIVVKDGVNDIVNDGVNNVVNIVVKDSVNDVINNGVNDVVNIGVNDVVNNGETVHAAGNAKVADAVQIDSDDADIDANGAAIDVNSVNVDADSIRMDADTSGTWSSNAPQNDFIANDKARKQREAEARVHQQLESLRDDATKSIVHVLQKLDTILDRREKLVLPDAQADSSSSSTTSSTSSSTSSSSSSTSSTSSPSSSTHKETQEKLLSATKLKDELDSLVGDALHLVDDKLRRHWIKSSTTESSTSSSSASSISSSSASSASSSTSSAGAQSAKDDLKELLEKLEEKSRKREKERKTKRKQ